MLHFIKYCLTVILLFIVLNFFRSNLSIEVNLAFDVPYIFEWTSPAFSFDFIILLSFCAGILFAAFFGALRQGMWKKRYKELHKGVSVSEKIPPSQGMDSLATEAVSPVVQANPTTKELPPLAG
jgi:uncharacterized integral membrane protein